MKTLYFFVRVTILIALLGNTNIAGGNGFAAEASPHTGNGLTSRFCDYFDGSSLSSGWTWVDPLGDSSFSLTANPGYLRLYTPDGGHDLYPGDNFNAPRLVQSIGGDFVVTTKVIINPTFNYQGAGLLIWQDVNNYIRLERTLVDGIDMWYRVGGVYGGIQIHFSNPTVYLMLQRSGDTVIGSYSENGSTWTTATTRVFPAASTLQVGMVLINQWQDHPLSADFDYFEVDSCSSTTIVDEARFDKGMPYPSAPYHRDCPSDYVGCGGPYHGFFKGVCTDLVMDAYNAGASFNIQSALSQDNIAHPGRYRYGSARNAEDMRRYFSYNQSLLLHSQPYQPGDVAFFDWDGDGLTNHVLVISEVDANNRPTKMVDASGVIPSINLSGLAFEHSWSSYYDQFIQSHARLSSINLAPTTALTETLQELRVTVNSSSVGLSLFDSNGKSVSEVYDDNLVASNIETSIPYIPGGSYSSLGGLKVITVTQPLSNTNQYSVRVEGQTNTSYTLLIETLQDSLVTASQTFTQVIGVGETQNTGITITSPSGVISFITQSPASSPVVSLPSSLLLRGLIGTSAQLTFTVFEIGSQQAISNSSITATDLATQYGIKLLSAQLGISPTNFSVAAGGNQQVDVQVNLTDLNSGEYLGSLILTTQNGNPMMIPFTLQVLPHTLYSPLITKN